MKENKMGLMPVHRLLVTMSIPMILSMLVQALYNVVDSMFVAQINENALTAVSLAFPLQNFMIAIAVGTGVGVNSLLSKTLGEQKKDLANRIATNAILLALFSFIFFAIFGILISRYFFTMQTDVAQIITYGSQYTTIITVASLGFFLGMIIEKVLASTGKTTLTMLTQAAGAVINIILDPIFIFGFNMGVPGAAIATVIGQTAGAFLGLYLNHTLNKEVQIQWHHLKPELSIIKNIYAVGIPSIIMTSVSSVMTFGMNKILISFSTTATAVFGIYFKLQSFVYMPIFGINNGLVPILAYNFGARKPERITKTFKLAATYATAITTFGFILFQLFPSQLLGIFNASDTMLEIGIPAMKIISIHFIFAGFNIVCSSSFQALRHGMYSLWNSVLRQLLLLLPIAYFFAQINAFHFIWLAFPISEITCTFISVILLIRIYKKQVKPLAQ